MSLCTQRPVDQVTVAQYFGHDIDCAGGYGACGFFSRHLPSLQGWLSFDQELLMLLFLYIEQISYIGGRGTLDCEANETDTGKIMNYCNSMTLSTTSLFLKLFSRILGEKRLFLTVRYRLFLPLLSLLQRIDDGTLLLPCTTVGDGRGPTYGPTPL